MKKKPDPIVTFVYEKPKTEQEAKLAEANLNKAYDVLFSETLRRLKEKDPKGIWGYF